MFSRSFSDGHISYLRLQVRGMASLEGGGNIHVLAFNYLSSSEISPDKRGGFCFEGPYKRGTNVYISKYHKITIFTIVLFNQWITLL
jgi:hypothetical protein